MIQEICRYAGLKRKNDLDCPGTADVNKEKHFLYCPSLAMCNLVWFIGLATIGVTSSKQGFSAFCSSLAQCKWSSSQNTCEQKKRNSEFDQNPNPNKKSGSTNHMDWTWQFIWGLFHLTIVVTTNGDFWGHLCDWVCGVADYSGYYKNLTELILRKVGKYFKQCLYRKL